MPLPAALGVGIGGMVLRCFYVGVATGEDRASPGTPWQVVPPKRLAEEVDHYHCEQNSCKLDYVQIAC